MSPAKPGHSKKGGRRAGPQGAAAKGGFEQMLQAVGQEQDKEAFIGLFEHFAPRVKSYLMRGGLAPETADELAQETMLSVWDKADSYNPDKAGAGTWIFTIARNKKIDFMRRREQIHVDLDDLALPDETAAGPPDQTMRGQEMQLLAEAIGKLPEEQAGLLYKSFFEDKTHAEIAEETGIPLGTIKSRIRLALDKLRGQPGIRELWQ